LSIAGVFVVIVITLLAFDLHLGLIPSISVYLLFVVVQSLSGDFVSSAIVSLLAVGCLDYYFTPPFFSFQVESPLDTLALVAFLVTGVVIARLVTKVRAGNELSRFQRDRLRRLYEFAQRLLSSEPSSKDGAHFLDPFCGVFGIRAVCLLDAAEAELYIAGNPSDELEKRTGQAFIHDGDCDDRDSGFVARGIRAGGGIIGAIGFEGLEDPDLTAGPLAALATAHLQRMHYFTRASKAAATAQMESYRSAILDALAHEFKTPLSTILTAAGALREASSLGPQHHEMTEIVEAEAARLSRLTSRLIRTARLEREEIRPWVELIDVSSVIEDTVDQYTRLSASRRVSVVKDCGSSEVMADPELLRLAVSQLLDNACKYSNPGSTVVLRIARENSQIAVRVSSTGNPVPAEERSRIFERFYRGVDGRRSGPGSGLGLFVARKIAVALGGSIELDSDDPGASNGTVFRLALPVPANDRDDVATTA
jgi:two-component system sensor histidine kinase KdpD